MCNLKVDLAVFFWILRSLLRTEEKMFKLRLLLFKFSPFFKFLGDLRAHFVVDSHACRMWY